MIGYQLFIWAFLSVFTGVAAYFVLTEGKSRFLMVTSFFFSLFFGISTSYIWLQTTNGLAMYDWGLYLLPILFSFMAELLYLSYYKAYHPKATFPRVPTFAVSKASTAISAVMIFFLFFLLASSYTVDTGDAVTSIATTGSSGTTTVMASELFDETLTETSSDAIRIQNSVVSPSTMRNNPKQGEYLNFKVEFKPSFAYAQPSLKVFVQDVNGELISEGKIVSYATANNILEGQILCDELGIFEITVLAYDLAVSSDAPLASNTQSYTVQSIYSADEGYNTVVGISLLAFISIICLVFAVALWRKYT